MATTNMFDLCYPIDQEAEDFAYAQASYHANSTVADMSGGPGAGYGLLGGLLGSGTSVTNTSQPLQSSTTLTNPLSGSGVQYGNSTLQQMQGAQALYQAQMGAVSNQATTNNGLYPVTATFIRPGGIYAQGLGPVMQPPMPAPPPIDRKAYFFLTVDRIEGNLLAVFSVLCRDYDDMVVAMLDRRRFHPDKVDLTAFISFCIVNGIGGQAQNYIDDLEARGIVFVVPGDGDSDG